MVWTIADMPSQQGRLAVVTGTGGLGYETALGFARAGGEVVLAGRNPDRGAASIARIRNQVSGAAVRFGMLDLADLASVEAFAAGLIGEGRPIDILVNNAGVMSLPGKQVTVDGFERQLGVNYLGHFALTMRLLPLLQGAAAPRVVSVASVVHRRGKIEFDNLQAERVYHPRHAYEQSKLAMLMFALELDRCARAAGSDLASIAAHPGVSRTDLFANGPGLKGAAAVALGLILPLVSHSAAAGALPLLFAATAPDAVSGGYYGPVNFFEMKGPVGVATIAPQAQDVAVARELWRVSEVLTGLGPSWRGTANAT